MVKLKTKETRVKKAKPKNFKIDDRVWLRNLATRVGRSGPMGPQWLGPYKILEKIGEVNYRIKIGRKEDVVHADRLKLQPEED